MVWPMQSALHLVAGKDPVQVLVPPVNENSKYVGGMGTVPVLGAKKAGPPPGRKMSGSIDVIGGGAPSLPSRRPGGGKEGVIQVRAASFSFSSSLPRLPSLNFAVAPPLPSPPLCTSLAPGLRQGRELMYFMCVATAEILEACHRTKCKLGRGTR